VIRHPLRVASLGIAVFLAGLLIVPRLGEALLPEFKERDFLTHWISKPGTSLPEERRIVTAASRDLRAIPGVQSFGSHIGQALLAEEIVGANFGENWITIDPAADYDETLAAIQEVVDSYPGLYHDVLTYFNERVDEVLAGSTEPIVIRIFGEDLDELRSQARDIKHLLAEIPGVAEEHVSFQEDVPQVEVRVDLAAAQRYGLKPGDVRRAAATLMNGEEVGDIFRDGKAYDVNVWSTPETRNSLTDIRLLPLDTPGGRQVLLSDVAQVRIRSTPNAIEREGDSRRIDVEASVEGRDLGSVVRDVEAAMQGVRFPLGYHAELLGEYAERQAAQGRLLLYALFAAAIVFLLLRVALHTWRLAWLAFLDLPIALAGGVIAIYLAGATVSLGALVGFFTVLGIAARTGIMMINHFQHLERFEGETFGSALVLRGARERLSPIMMTALATGLAVIPLVLAGDLPGHEIEHPMAIVIVGGLITSTFRNLFIVPTGSHEGRGDGRADDAPAHEDLCSLPEGELRSVGSALMDDGLATPRPPETSEFGAVKVGGPVHDYPADGSLQVRKVAVGPYQNNVYVLISGSEALIVDGSDEPDRILSLVEGLTVSGIAQTHNHFDHVAALPALVEALGAPVYAHPDDPPPVPFTAIAEGDVLKVAGVRVTALHTPGHTPGSLCYASEAFLFSGDTLFPAGPGKTGDPERFAEIMGSLDRLFTQFPDDTRVCPGHGIDTRIGRERPYVETWRSRGW
jgi:glyoxylase-like metal-dependent hydrolase (beta-lactamase superfamily II)